MKNDMHIFQREIDKKIKLGRRDLVNEAILKKIDEINKEIEECGIALEALKNSEKKYFEMYCEKNDHNYMLIDSKPYGLPKCINTYKCQVCGKKFIDYYGECKKLSIKEYNQVRNSIITNGGGHGLLGGGYRKYLYKQVIPENLYDDSTIMENGKTLREVKNEFEKIEDYYRYLKSLKETLCKFFGHDEDSCCYPARCICCEAPIDRDEYNESLENAIYKGVIPGSEYLVNEENYIISQNKKIRLKVRKRSW